MKFKWFLVANIIIANNRSYQTQSKLPTFIEKVSNGWGGFKNFSTNQFTNTLFNFNKSMDPKIDIAAISNKDKYFTDNMEYLIEKITDHSQIHQDNGKKKQTINNINIEDSDDEFKDCLDENEANELLKDIKTEVKNQDAESQIDSDDEFQDAYSDFNLIPKTKENKEKSTKSHNSKGNTFRVPSFTKIKNMFTFVTLFFFPKKGNASFSSLIPMDIDVYKISPSLFNGSFPLDSLPYYQKTFPVQGVFTLPNVDYNTTFPIHFDFNSTLSVQKTIPFQEIIPFQERIPVYFDSNGTLPVRERISVQQYSSDRKFLSYEDYSEETTLKINSQILSPLLTQSIETLSTTSKQISKELYKILNSHFKSYFEQNNTKKNFDWWNNSPYILLGFLGLNHLNGEKKSKGLRKTMFKLTNGQKRFLRSMMVGAVAGFKPGVNHWILSGTKPQDQGNKKLKDSSKINSPDKHLADKDFFPYLVYLAAIELFTGILAPGYIPLSIFQALAPVVFQSIQNILYPSKTINTIINKNIMDVYSRSNYGVDQIYQLIHSLKKGEFPGSQLANIYTVVLYEQIPYIGKVLKLIKTDNNNTYFFTKEMNALLIHKDKIDEDSVLNTFIDGLWFVHETNFSHLFSMLFPKKLNKSFKLSLFKDSLDKVSENLGNLIPKNDLIDYSINLGEKSKAREAEEIQKRKEKKQRKTSNSKYGFTSPSPEILRSLISFGSLVKTGQELKKSFESKKNRQNKTLQSGFQNTIKGFSETFVKSGPALEKTAKVFRGKVTEYFFPKKH